MKNKKAPLNGGDLDIDFIFENYDNNKHNLSKESLEKTAHLTENFSNEMRFMYDKFTKLLSYEKFHKYAKELIIMNQAEDKKQMVTHLSAPRIEIILINVKKNFVNLLDVEE